MKRVTPTRSRGVTVVELVVAATIVSMVTAALSVGISTLQRSFRASQHHVKSQIEQARFIDYVGRDLRRALSVSVDTYQNNARLNVTIPDFYEPDGTPADLTDNEPRTPVIAGRTVNYGDPANQVRVGYYKSGSTILRTVNDVPMVLATEVQDFSLSFTDSGRQTVRVMVTFQPTFQLGGRRDMRLGTTASATVLLRNKRR
jgi:type II secretory pathway component PulJ